jgi:hypothetical protein
MNFLIGWDVLFRLRDAHLYRDQAHLSTTGLIFGHLTNSTRTTVGKI